MKILNLSFIFVSLFCFGCVPMDSRVLNEEQQVKLRKYSNKSLSNQ